MYLRSCGERLMAGMLLNETLKLNSTKQLFETMSLNFQMWRRAENAHLGSYYTSFATFIDKVCQHAFIAVLFLQCCVFFSRNISGEWIHFQEISLSKCFPLLSVKVFSIRIEFLCRTEIRKSQKLAPFVKMAGNLSRVSVLLKQ